MTCFSPIRLRESIAGIDKKIVFVLPVRGCGLFQHFTDAGEARAALEHGAQFPVLLRRAHGKDFDAAVVKIANEATDAQFFRSRLREIAEAHTLDPAGDKIALSLFRVAHECHEIVAESSAFWMAAAVP